MFKKFLDVLKSKGAFDGVVEGTPEYDSRYRAAVAKFAERMGNTATATATATAAPAAAPAAVSNDEAAAESAKGAGNTALNAGRFSEAVDAYTRALELAPTGKNIHIYYANRSAAKMSLKDYDGAVADARASVAADAGYVKGYTRLGAALKAKGQVAEAAAAYERALDLDAGNDVARNGLIECKSSKGSSSSASASSSAVATSSEDDAADPMAGLGGLASMLGGGGGGLGGLASMLGGGGGGEGGGLGGLAGLMNNPMVQQMMRDPAMMSMAQNMMKDPNAMAQMASMLGGGRK
jgi:small glutamine-rich tetratricopeptide repeat-containing protein alpha